MNLFRMLGDLSHLASFMFLLQRLWEKKTAVGSYTEAAMFKSAAWPEPHTRRILHRHKSNFTVGSLPLGLQGFH
jgi:hypothetical protein